MIAQFCAWLLRFKWPVLGVLALATAFMAYQGSRVAIKSDPIDLFPSNHPYVETFLKYADTFGGASSVLLSVEVKEGTIFNVPTLRKIQRLTRAIERLPGINNYQVISIAQKKIKEARLDPVHGLQSTPLMWPEVPSTAEEVAELQHRIHSNPNFHGTLVSKDDKAALIVAGFFDDKLEPRKIYQAVNRLIEQETDANTTIHSIGRPILLGQIMQQFPELGGIMLLTSLAMVLGLLVYFRSLNGVLVPVTAALMSAAMGFGSLGLLGFNFDPLVLVIPFVITARAISHSVQVVSRFADDYTEIGDRHQAAVHTATALFRPGTLAILTDTAGILLIYLAPIPLLQKLALMGAFWLLSIFLSGMVLSPILLSILPVGRRRSAGRSLFERALGAAGRLVTGKGRFTVFGVTAFAMLLGIWFASSLVIGDVHLGTPQLWPDSRFNNAVARVAQRFANTESLTVVVEGATRDAIKNPEVLKTMEAFQRHMEALDEVGSSSSLADQLPSAISLYYGGDPNYALIPNDKRQAGYFLEMLYTRGDPGDLTRFVTIGSQNANITLNLRDHKGDTLRTVVAHAKQFLREHPVEGVQFRLAGGLGGLYAAINEEVASLDAQITLAAFAAVLLCCSLAFRSLFAGLLFMLPLIGSNYMTYALMGALGIGLDINVLPVVALGVGLGVDYGIYVVEAIQESFRRTGSRDIAISEGLTRAGKGVLVTGMTMGLGLVFWRLSFLRFQAEMGMLLFFWMMMSMLGGLLLLPAILRQLTPRFVFPHDVPNVPAQPHAARIATFGEASTHRAQHDAESAR